MSFLCSPSSTTSAAAYGIRNAERQLRVCLRRYHAHNDQNQSDSTRSSIPPARERRRRRLSGRGRACGQGFTHFGACHEISVRHPAARRNPFLTPTFGRDFAACYDHNSSHQALFEKEVEPLLGYVLRGVVRPVAHRIPFGSFHLLEDCICILLWRQLVRKDYHHVRKQHGPRYYPSGGPGEYPLSFVVTVLR